MARGIANRQKKVVAAKKVWVKPPPAVRGAERRRDSKLKVPGSRKPDAGHHSESR
jgi:hypothetical protein